jgi:hypothetical protein
VNILQIVDYRESEIRSVYIFILESCKLIFGHGESKINLLIYKLGS